MIDQALVTKIAQDAIGLYTFYPKAAKEYARARDHRQFAVEIARRNNWTGWGGDDISARDLQLQNERCDRHWHDLKGLRVAVAGMLPQLKLKIIPLVGDPWHKQDNFDWSEACRELQQVQFAAVSVINSTNTDTQSSTTILTDTHTKTKTKAANINTRKRAGRKDKWIDLRALADKLRASDSSITDKAIVSKYNKLYSGPIAEGKRDKATVAALRNSKNHAARKQNTKPR